MESFATRSRAMKMRLSGFTRKKAIWWDTVVEYSKKISTSPSKDWAYDNGFLPEFVDRYGITEENVDEYASIYDLSYLFPINDIFRKWFKDRVTTRKVLKPFKEYMPKQYYHVYLRDNQPIIIKSDDCPADKGDTTDDMLALIQEKGIVSIAMTAMPIMHTVEYASGQYIFNGDKVTREELLNAIARIIQTKYVVVQEYVDNTWMPSDVKGFPNTVRIIVTNKHVDDPEISQAYLRVAGPDIDDLFKLRNSHIATGENALLSDDWLEDTYSVKSEKDMAFETFRYYYAPVCTETGKFDGGKYLNKERNKIEDVTADAAGRSLTGEVPHWDEITKVAKDICAFVPQIEIFEADVAITDDGFKFVYFTDDPYYPQAVGYNKSMTDYFRMKVEQKQSLQHTEEKHKENVKKRAETVLWTRMAKLIAPEGMRPLVYKWWYENVKEDITSHNGVSMKDKMWAYKHGFLSYRMPQYGINRENYQHYISDYDYIYIRHINNKYRTWLEDKLTVKYICSEHSQYFPKYYYQFTVRNDEQKLIRLMDLPEDCGADVESIFTLVERVGSLACKPQKGSYGRGFYKLSYEDGKYYMNHKETDRDEIINILTDRESCYFITEYIVQHPDINKIYPGAVNTMRIITFMMDGKTTQIGNAYMRFGSKKTGAVDNMSAGGMFAEVDMETGKISNGKIITENTILPCTHHPDTKEPIDGYIPNWDIVKKGIVELNHDMPELEYLGFDVALTEDGIKLPEINRSPGYPKIETFNRPTIDYLLYKKEKKMEKYDLSSTKW